MGMGRMVLMRKGEELRKHLRLYSFLKEQSRHPESSREQSLVLESEVGKALMDRRTERQEEQSCELQRLVTTHKGLLGGPRRREHPQPFGSS